MIHINLIKTEEELENRHISIQSYLVCEFQKGRIGIRFIAWHGERATANKVAANEFVKKFGEHIESECFILQVFNCDENSLIWNKMPNRIYITQEEKLCQGRSR